MILLEDHRFLDVQIEGNMREKTFFSSDIWNKLVQVDARSGR